MAEHYLYLDTELTSTSGAEKNAQIRKAEQETSTNAINRELHNDFAIDKTVKKENEIKHLIKSLKENKINDTEAETGSTTSLDSQNPNTEAERGFEITESSSSPLDLIHGQNDSNDSKRHTHVEILETRIGENSFGTNTSEQETKLIQNESNNVESRSSEKSDTLINPKSLTTKAYTSFEITGSDIVSLKLTIDEQNDMKRQTRTEIYSTGTKANPFAKTPPKKEHASLHNENSGSSNEYTIINSQNLNTEDDKRFIITESGSDPNDNRQQMHSKVNETRIKTNSCATNSFEQENKLAQNGNETNDAEVGSKEESDILTNSQNLTTEDDTSFEISERRSVSLELIKDEQIDSKTQPQAEIDETRIKTNSCAINTAEQETNMLQNETDNTEGEYSEASTLIIQQTQNHETDTSFEIVQNGSVPIEPIIDSIKQTYEVVKDIGTKSNSLFKDAPEEEQELVNNENKTSDVDGGASEESAILNSQYLNTAADKNNSVSFATIINDQNDSEKKTHKDINQTRIKTNCFATNTPEQETKLIQNESNNVESRSSEKLDILINPKSLTTKGYTSFEIPGSDIVSLELTIDEQNDMKKQTRTEMYSTDIKANPFAKNPPKKEHASLHNENTGSSNEYTIINSHNLNTEDKRFIITESGSDPNDNRQQMHSKVNETRIKTNSCATNSFEQETKLAQDENEPNDAEVGSKEESDILTNSQNLTTEADKSFEITERRSVSLELIKDEQIDSKTQTQAEIDETRIKTNSCATNTAEQETNMVQNGNEIDNTEGGYSESSTLIIPQTHNHETDTSFEIIQSGSVPIEPIIDSIKQTYEVVKDIGTKSNSLFKDAPEEEQELVNNENKTSDTDGGASEESAILNSQYLNTAADTNNSVSFAKINNDQKDSEKQTHKDINLTRIKTNSFATNTPEQVTSLFQNVNTEKSTIFSATYSRYNLKNGKPIQHACKKTQPKKLPQINSAAKLLETTKNNEETLSFEMKQSCKQQTYSHYDKGSLYCFVHNVVVSYWCKQCNAAKCEKCVNVAYCKRCVRHDVITMAKHVQDTKRRHKARVDKNSIDCLTELDRSIGVFKRNEKHTQLQALYQRERIRQEFVSFHDLLITAEDKIMHTLDKAVDEYASQYKLMEKKYGSIVEEEAHLMAETLRKTDDPFGYSLTDVDMWIDTEWSKLKEKIHTMTVSVQPVPRIVQQDFVLLKEKTDLRIKFSSVVEPCEIIQTVSTLYLEEESMVSPIRICDLFACTNSLYCFSELILEINIRREGKLEFKGKMKYEDYVFNYGNRHDLQDNQRYLVRARPFSMSGEELPLNSKCKHVLIVTGQNTFSVKAGLMGYLEDVRERHGIALLPVSDRTFVPAKSSQWQFSSVAGNKYLYDFSPEELRCIAYQTDAANYMTCYSHLWNDIQKTNGALYKRYILLSSTSDVEMCTGSMNTNS